MSLLFPTFRVGQVQVCKQQAVGCDWANVGLYATGPPTIHCTQDHGIGISCTRGGRRGAGGGGSQYVFLFQPFLIRYLVWCLCLKACNFSFDTGQAILQICVVNKKIFRIGTFDRRHGCVSTVRIFKKIKKKIHPILLIYAWGLLEKITRRDRWLMDFGNDDDSRGSPYLRPVAGD